MNNQVKGSNSKGARALYSHLTKGNLFGIADKIKAERKGNAKNNRRSKK